MKAGMPIVPRARDRFTWAAPGIGDVAVTVKRVARDRTWAGLTCVLPERTWHRRQRLRRGQLPASFTRIPNPMEIGMTDQLSLFEDVPAVPVKVPRPVVGVRWSDYHVAKHVQCDHCVKVVHERGGAGPVDIREARRKRATADGDLLLCHPHAQIQHDADVAAGLVGKGKTTASARKGQKVHS